MSEQTAPVEVTEAERERQLLEGWFIERTDHFDPGMLAGMRRDAAGCAYAVAHGDNVTMTRDVFIKLLKSASQPQMQPETFTREP
jgi:sugar lactone lactonase YvrE